MAYNERLAERVRDYFKRCKEVEEKRMFVGLCFMPNGHMCCGVEKNRLMIRVFPDRYDVLLKKAHVREMDFICEPLKEYLWKSKPPFPNPLQTSGG